MRDHFDVCDPLPSPGPVPDFGSVFSPRGHGPFFRPLGNEAGSDMIFIWWRMPMGEEVQISVCTSAPDESDPDIIEAYTSRIFARNRAEFRLAYRLAREIASGKLVPATWYEPGASYEIAGNTGVTICAEFSLNHFSEVA